MNKLKATIRLKGGAGSGHYGHSGRPGEVGGSSSDVGKDSDVYKPKFQVGDKVKIGRLGGSWAKEFGEVREVILHENQYPWGVEIQEVLKVYNFGSSMIEECQAMSLRPLTQEEISQIVDRRKKKD